MKKSILLILCLTFVTMPSLASVDINTLSDEELLLLHAQVRQALYDRSNIESIEMPPGTYEAGKDFPAGSYTIKNLSEDDDIFSYSSIETYFNRRAMLIYMRQIEVTDLEYLQNAPTYRAYVVDTGQTLNLNLEKGMIVICSGSIFKMTPFFGLIIKTK